MKIHKLTLAALLVAIGTLSAHLIYIPAGISKCFPVQHAINVLGAVILGPGYATAVAFVISCLRNMFGTGSLLAFPGSMIGACLAGLCYSRFGSVKAAMAGEIFRHRYFRRTDCLGHRPFLLEQRGSSLVLYPAVPDQHCRRQYHRRTDH